GADPFIAADATPAPGVRVLKREMADVEGVFRLVMMHHAFEHMPDPEGALRESARLLAPGGHLLIRIPLAGTYAARTYVRDWVQLDAPRHHVLHTERSIALLAVRTGFDVESVVYDSSAFQFWASEQYRRDIPLCDPRSHFVSPSASSFSPEEIAAFQRQAEELNAAGDGDQAAFYLRRR
ncbi:MAG TPA: class I SAM-dependent methyltransferase, partial [Rhodothermales bacterium]|nr:class I SAM-dependent methyltransferase [Rhodothermales bacterium]